MLAIKFAKHVGNFVKRFIGSNVFFHIVGLQKLFPPIVMFAIVQNQSDKVLFPCIPWW
jgi:hypothetical protein